jgi:hypothetical protein
MNKRSLQCTLIAAALVLPAALSWAQGGLSEEPGYDRRGGDIDSFRTRRLEECKSACRRDDRCVAYSYLVGRQECYLKNRVYPMQPSRDAVTGVKAGNGWPGGGGEAGNLTEERGYDRRGNDYTHFRVRGVSECKRSCAGEDRCRAYTFDTRSSECWLKDRVNSASSNGAMVTGYKSSSGPIGGGGGRLTEEPGLDRRGDDYDSFRARGVGDCQRSCREQDRCRAYTYVASSRTCYLKSRVNSPQRNRDAVTGYKQ